MADTADTSAIEAALAEEHTAWVMVAHGKTWLRQLLADNARLTAALGEAEGTCDRLRATLQDVIKVGGALDLAAADAATGRAVGRWLRDGWKPGGPEGRPRIYWWQPGMTGPSPPLTPAEAAWLASLDAEEGT